MKKPCHCGACFFRSQAHLAIIPIVNRKRRAHAAIFSLFFTTTAIYSNICIKFTAEIITNHKQTILINNYLKTKAFLE